MKNKIKYSDGPIDQFEIVDDFLPSPDELKFKEDTVKVTIALSKSSVQFFKEKAGENKSGNNAGYQKMIRRLLDSYVDKYSNP